MARLNKWAMFLLLALVFSAVAMAQVATDSCKPSPVIPLANGDQQPPPKILIDPPLAGPLSSRGVVIIQYCAQNLHIVPVFGPNAVSVSPRIGHVHVALDDAPWVWADASGNPIILQGLPPGPHKVRIDLVDANHHQLDTGTITFAVPGKTAAEQHR
ncbi:MAG TPA: DUF6130 family protein [Terriglobales bacterium]